MAVDLVRRRRRLASAALPITLTLVQSPTFTRPFSDTLLSAQDMTSKYLSTQDLNLAVSPSWIFGLCVGSE